MATKPPTLLDTEGARRRAEHPYATSPRPFLKWPGSKRHLLPALVEALPEKIGVYHEPFLGSGALFFLLQPTRAYLSDIIPSLVTTYNAVRKDPSAVLRALSRLPVGKTAYYNIRAKTPRSPVAIAARFIYLNKTCWNGLYRVNASGGFNVPMGTPQQKPLIDSANLHACSRVLHRRSVKLAVEDFAHVADVAERGDFVYLDPPYVAVHSSNGFRDYNETLFSWEDQQRLAEMASALVSRGVRVLISNADHHSVRALYPDFRARSIRRESTLAADITRRGSTSELLLTPKH